MENKNQRGKIKWFNVEKGYGFVTDNENNDLYFGVKDVVGAELPEIGDIVIFDLYIGKEKTEAARNLVIYEKKNPSLKQFHCEGCKRDVEPKAWHYGGSDYTSVSVELFCPFCGYKILKKGGGFNIFAKVILFVFVLSLGFVIYKLA